MTDAEIRTEAGKRAYRTGKQTEELWVEILRLEARVSKLEATVKESSHQSR